MILLLHVGLAVEEMGTLDTTLVIHKDSKDTIMIILTDSDIDGFHGFMKCLKVQNKKMCDICNNKNKCLRQCGNCKQSMYRIFKNNNQYYISSCPFYRLYFRAQYKEADTCF